MEYVSRKLIEIEIDVVSVVSRLGGDEQLYLSICRKYIKDQNFRLFNESIIRNDFSAAEFYIHTLKGIAANLGFIRLEARCKDVLDDLRINKHRNIKTYINYLCEEHNRILFVFNEEQTLHFLDTPSQDLMLS
ncbi:MAG: hypothetical protein ACYDEX_19880 [Mobilitalea sp.]